jgi:hypothetical protein
VVPEMQSASTGNRTRDIITASLHIQQYHPLNKSCSAVQQWSGAKGSFSLFFNSVTPNYLQCIDIVQQLR